MVMVAICKGIKSLPERNNPMTAVGWPEFSVVSFMLALNDFLTKEAV
jgi:hypothetical protein